MRLFAKRMVSAMAVIGMLLTAAPVFAAETRDAVIDPQLTCNLTIYKYDYTNAHKDGIWTDNSYVSTGRYDANVNQILGTAIRQGSDDSNSTLGNGEVSSGYAIKGVEYTYLKVADAYQFSQPETSGAGSRVELLYAFDKSKASDLLTAIGLPDGAESDPEANTIPGNESNWYYRSDTIHQALTQALTADATNVKNALERYMTAQGGTAMPVTDGNGRSMATNLPVGLYLLVETAVPEMVTSTTNPFFVSLPMTSINGGGNGENGNNTVVTDGGREWRYDVTIYPKNDTGIVTLEKTVREAKADGGKNNASDAISDGYAHNATGSAGDTMEYQIITTLPTITSNATSLTTYNIYDSLCPGLSYRKDFDTKLEIFTDKACTDKVASWTQNDGRFTVTYSSDDRHMTVDITPAGLAEINAETTNIHGALLRGFSNYTLRVTYTAVIHSDSSFIYGDNGNDNKAVLTWKRTSGEYFDTLMDDCHIYSYGIDLQKVFSDNPDNASELYRHVKFKIWNETDQHWLTARRNDQDGIYYVTGHVMAEADATVFYPVPVDGKPGRILIKGLEDDEYILTEIETADRYTLLRDQIHVTIHAADDPSRSCRIYTEDSLGVLQNDPHYAFDGGLDLHLANIPQKQLAHNMLTANASIDGNQVAMTEDGNSAHALAPLTVVNTRGFDLPQTGDISALLLPLLGGCSIGLFLIFRFLQRDKKEHE